LAIPDQGQFLPLERDLERLPLARRLREVLAGKGPLVEGAAVVEAELRLAVTVEDLDLEESTVVHARVAPLGDVELQVELVVGERLGRQDVGAASIVATEQDRARRPALADGEQPGRVGGIEPDLVAGDPDLLRARIAESPAR